MPLTKIQSLGITDGTIVNADINASAAIAGTKLSGAGITEADQWRLTTSFTGDATPISLNWERSDTYSTGYIGSGITQSSGIFTFPSTGYYLIIFKVYGSATIAQLYHTAAIQVTTNNSTYNTASSGDLNYYGGTSYGSTSSQYIIDVTDITNVKVRFTIDAVGSSTSTLGNTNENQTAVTFIRLGDT